jgi:hypothetical protein
VINKLHEGRQVDRQEEGKDDGNLKDPPEVRRMADKSNTVGTPEGTEDTRNVQFNPIMLQKKRTRDLAVVPDSKAPQDKTGSLVEGSILINRRGEPPCAIGRCNKVGGHSIPKYTMVVQMYIHCPSGNVKELIMELIFEGLATLHAEDKTVCFLHPLDFNQQARKHTDMPVKFKKIHEEWVCFDQVIGRFKNHIKEGRTRTYNVSIWLGSDKEPKKLVDSCTLKWKEARANGGVVKVQYKKMQSLHTSHHFILVGIPMDIDLDSLQTMM